jgi:hypothetical protein
MGVYQGFMDPHLVCITHIDGTVFMEIFHCSTLVVGQVIMYIWFVSFIVVVHLAFEGYHPVPIFRTVQGGTHVEGW